MSAKPHPLVASRAVLLMPEEARMFDAIGGEVWLRNHLTELLMRERMARLSEGWIDHARLLRALREETGYFNKFKEPTHG